MTTLGYIGEKLDLLVKQGSTLGPFKVTLANPGQTPVDLTGATVRGHIRKKALDTTLAATLVVTVTEAANGKFEFGLPDEVTATIQAGETIKDAASLYVWDMELEDASGRVVPLYYGDTAGASSVPTVSAAWTVVPDATSVYRIEGNDDYFYLLGNNAVTMYRYSISGNTWTTLAPTAARAGASAAGGTADWIDAIQATEWNDGTYSNHYTTALVHQLGRYLYCFRGGASNVLDAYDIAANTWISGIAYGQQMETFTTGSCSVDLNGYIYIQKDATGRIYRFDVAKHALEPFVLNPVPQGAAVVSDKMFMTTLNEGATRLNYLYTLGNTRAELTRWLVI